jgi:hypothetical protein
MRTLLKEQTFSRLSKDQLEAVLEVLRFLDVEEYRDYHDTYGVCNAPEQIVRLKAAIEKALTEADR